MAWVVVGIGGLALYLLHGTQYDALWWRILAAGSLFLLTAMAVKQAYAMAAQRFAFMAGLTVADVYAARMPFYAFGEDDAGVVRFWIRSNMLLAVISVVLSGAGIYLSATKSEGQPGTTGNTPPGTTPEQRAGDAYPSIEAFFRSVEYLSSLQMMAKKPNRADPQGDIDLMKTLAGKVVNEGSKVQPTKLDDLYLGWGTHFRDEFLIGGRTLLQGLVDLDKSQFGRADAYFARWDTWYHEHHQAIFLTLHRKFGFEVRKE